MSELGDWLKLPESRRHQSGSSKYEFGAAAAGDLDCSLGDAYLNISSKKGTTKELQNSRNCLMLILKRAPAPVWKHCLSQRGSVPLPVLILTSVPEQLLSLELHCPIWWPLATCDH